MPSSITTLCCCCIEQIFIFLQCLICDAQGQVTTKPRRGRTEMSLVTEPPGRGRQQLPGENGQGLRVLLRPAGRGQTSQVPRHGVHSSRHCLLVHGGAGVGDETLECLRNPSFRGNMPVQKAWPKKGQRAHRDFPSRVPWSMMQTVADMDGAT